MTTKPYGLGKGERLSSLTAVRRLFEDGVSGFVYPFRYTILIEESTSPTVEVLFSVPKRNHKRAYRRNLLRRRTKEAYRLTKESLVAHAVAEGKSIDMALVYSTKDVLSYKTIEHAVRNILREVVERC
ncbi:MAG: ribonuclease P protein component [Alistipes sp.]|nr:ribonuclease P protein component [Alistipes sp.]